MQVILEFLWLLLSFIIHLEAWKAEGRKYRAPSYGIQYSEKSAKSRREETKASTDEKFHESVVFQYKYKLPHDCVLICVHVFIHSHVVAHRMNLRASNLN